MEQFIPPIHDGLKLCISPALPVDETLPACSIEDRCEVSICTGNKIHCFQHDNMLIVSQELFDKIN